MWVCALSGVDETKVVKSFEGEARIGKVLKNFTQISLRPEDLSSPLAFQMAFTRIYESIIKIMEQGGPKPTYIAEIKFVDDLGNTIVVGVDLGDELPPFSKDRVKARVIIELYEEG